MGNVLVTLSDMLVGIDTIGGDTTAIYYMATVLNASSYYPFGAEINARSYHSSLEYAHGFNGKMNDKDAGAYDFGARLYNSQLGRWWSVDPEYRIYGHLSPYLFAANSPLLFKDLSGGTIIDYYGNPVEVIVNDDGSVDYKFTEGYNSKKLQNAKQQFEEKTLPILKVMTVTEVGRADVRYLAKIPTEVYLEQYEGTYEEYVAEEGSSSGAQYDKSKNLIIVNSRVNVVDNGKLSDGYRSEVTIIPFMGNYTKDNINYDLEEWIGAIMTIEVDHLTPQQIQLENKTATDDASKPAYSVNYQHPMNKNVDFRLKYRNQKKQPITEEVFSIIETANRKIEKAGGNKKITYENDAKQDWKNADAREEFLKSEKKE